MNQATLLSPTSVRANSGPPQSPLGHSQPKSDGDGFARALQSASESKRASEPDEAARSDAPAKTARPEAGRTERSRGGDGAEPVASRDGGHIDEDFDVSDLSAEQTERLKAIAEQLQKRLDDGASLQSLQAELKAMTADGQLPQSLTDWLSGQLQTLMDPAQSAGTAGSEAAAAWLSQLNTTLRQLASAKGESDGTIESVMSALKHKGTTAQSGQGTSHVASSSLSDNTQLSNALKDAQQTSKGDVMLGNGSPMEAKLDDGKLLGVVKLTANLAHQSNADAGTADKLSSSSLTALAEAAGQAQTRPSAVAAKPAVAAAQVATGFQQPGWGEAVGQKVMWLARQGVTSAELRLDPPDLGPVHVRISMQNDQAQVNFTSQHVMVREALDQSAARLRDMFAGQGIDLVDVDVSDQSGSQAQAEAEAQMAGSGRRGAGVGDADGESDAELAAEGEPGAVQTTVSLVDDYA